MNKKIILMSIKEKHKEKMQNNPNDTNLKLIDKILENELWYLQLDLDTFVDILITLDYTKDEALNLYLSLLS